jgi:hypothetical protein
VEQLALFVIQQLFAQNVSQLTLHQRKTEQAIVQPVHSIAAPVLQ